MGLGLALVKAASTDGGSALHGPAFVFDVGASIQGLKRIAWAASDGSEVRPSGLCLLMQGVFHRPKAKARPTGLCSRRDTWDAALRCQAWRAGSLWRLLGPGGVPRVVRWLFSGWMQLRSGLIAAFFIA